MIQTLRPVLLNNISLQGTKVMAKNIAIRLAKSIYTNLYNGLNSSGLKSIHLVMLNNYTILLTLPFINNLKLAACDAVYLTIKNQRWDALHAIPKFTNQLKRLNVLNHAYLRHLLNKSLKLYLMSQSLRHFNNLSNDFVCRV